MKAEELRRKQAYDQTISKAVPRSNKEQSILEKARGASQDVKDLLAIQMLEEGL
jgi:hypothetical protein